MEFDFFIEILNEDYVPHLVDVAITIVTDKNDIWGLDRLMRHCYIDNSLRGSVTLFTHPNESKCIVLEKLI